MTAWAGCAGVMCLVLVGLVLLLRWASRQPGQPEVSPLEDLDTVLAGADPIAVAEQYHHDRPSEPLSVDELLTSRDLIEAAFSKGSN